MNHPVTGSVIRFGAPTMTRMMMMSFISSPPDESNTRRLSINIYTDPSEMHRVMTNQMQEMFQSLTGIFGNMSTFFSDDNEHSFGDMNPGSENPNGSNIRDFYLKPGYRKPKLEDKQDVDLDGKISSDEISGLLTQQEKCKNSILGTTEAGGSLMPRTSFFQTVITTSITKPDGTVEIRRIVKDKNGTIEETTTTTSVERGTDINDLRTDALEQYHAGHHMFKDLLSMWKIF